MSAYQRLARYHKLIASLLAIALHLPLLWSVSHGLQRGNTDTVETTGQAIVLKMASASPVTPPVSPPAAAPAEITPAPKPPLEPPPEPTPPVTQTSVPTQEENRQDAAETSAANVAETDSTETDSAEANPIIGKEGDSQGAQDDALSRYKALLHTRVERLREYPPQARLRRQEGTVLVAFTIDRNGDIENFRVISSSGSSLLDRSVERLFSRLRLPPPDEAIVGQLADLQMPVLFELQ